VKRKPSNPKACWYALHISRLREFDANKIANSLIREGKVPADLAQKTAKKTEKLLVKSKIKYLTAA
jgi:anaerobic ribonucleoside-triphosphate reductase